MSKSPPNPELTTSSPMSVHNTTNCSSSGLDNSASLYSTALENLAGSTSFDDNQVNQSTEKINTTTELESILHGIEIQRRNSLTKSKNSTRNGENVLFTQSDSLDSQNYIDPKSLIGNKTIFRKDNPDLSIIEINDISTDQDLESSVVLVEELKKKNFQKFNNLVSNLKSAEAKQVAPDKNLQEQDKAKEIINNDPCENEHERKFKIYDTLEEFDKNLPSTVTKLDTPHGSQVYLVGTAHFSEESQDDVSEVIRNVRPDVVMVELCPSRAYILVHDEDTLLEEAKNFNISKIRSIIQAHGYINGIFFILLLQMTAQIGKDLGMATGGEFRRAYEEVNKIPGCMLHLGDRPIRVTLERALRALSLWQIMKLVWRLTTSSDTISIKEVEECKQSDLLEKLMQEMAGEFPEFSEVFVKERDMYLCHSLQSASMQLVQLDSSNELRPVRVVGIVGIGHANGVVKMWGKVDPSSIPAIMEIPPASVSTRIFKYTIKYGFIALTLYGTYKFVRPKLTRFF